MSPGDEEMAVTIRRGTAADIEPILDLLTEYGFPRSYFEPFYLNDTSYRPEHSWVVERNGRLLSHLRIYDRWIRVGRAKLHIAGVGNVITAQDARGHGYSGQIMRVMLPVLDQEGYAYSLLGTHIPHLYGRYGWVPVEQDLLQAVLPPSILGEVRITPFQEGDLPAIMRLYETTNAGRTGTTIRTPEYWREQSSWLHEDQDGFLVAHDMAEDVPVGYVRSRTMQNTVEILELGIERGALDIGRELLTATSMRRDGQLQGQLPPSMKAIFLQGEFSITPEPGLMGRVINLAELLHVLEPVWRDRIGEAGGSEGTLSLFTSAGQAAIQIRRNGNIQVNEPGTTGMGSSLNEREFAHLLLRGFDESAENMLGKRQDASFLRVLFPEQDFVIWQADAF
ncbi:MAG TPA: GNAT family N-acetyltransferase [Ktedonobacteraceae bacterium]